MFAREKKTASVLLVIKSGPRAGKYFNEYSSAEKPFTRRKCCANRTDTLERV